MLRKLLFGLSVGIAAACLALWAEGRPEMAQWERASWGLRARFFAKPSPSTAKIKLVVLDEESLGWAKRNLGVGWPWPREVYAPIIDFCTRGGAKVVAFDVLFLDPSPSGVEDDAALGTAFRSAPASVVAAQLGTDAAGSERWPAYLQPRKIPVDGLSSWLEAGDPSRIDATRGVFPIPEIATNVTYVADASGLPDPDGVFRRGHLLRRFDAQVVPSVGLAVYRAAQPDSLRIEKGWMHLGEGKVPIDEQTQVILRYRGAADVYERFSAAQVFQSEMRLREGGEPALSADTFKDTYVLLGFTAAALMDLRPTPVAAVAPGVFVHATLLDNLLERDALRDSPHAMDVLLTLLLCLVAGLAAVYCRKAWQVAVTLLVLLPLPALVSAGGYELGLWLPYVVLETGVAGALLLGIVLNYSAEGRQKAFISRAFRHYLSPDVIDQILKDPSKLQLGGERRELTIFFSDLQGFSSISERLEPQVLTALLNAYLTDMTEIILGEGGTLDKYEGDAIIAFWNAPTDQPDHAARAARAAVRCQQKLAERRADYRERSGSDLFMRVGVHTGAVVVGNMGSSNRFDYTVLGDAANLASRLEGANKAFGTYTMVSEATWEQAGAAVTGRELGRIRVVGRETPVRVFELTGLNDGTATPEHQAFARGLSHCYAGEWQKAARAFEEAEGDPAAARYAKRCREVLVKGAATWDGVWNLTEK